MKKHKMLIIKIIIIIVLSIALILGVVKLADFLAKPKTLFYSALETIEMDLNKISSTISTNKIYSLINNNTIEINGESKINITNLMKEENISAQEKIINASYINKLKYDQNNKYFSNEIIVNQNGEQKFDMIYIEDAFEKSFKDTTDGTIFHQLSRDNINIELIDLNKNIFISDTIKRNFSEALLEDNFTSDKTNININNETYECNVSMYKMSAEELTTLIDNIIDNITSNNETLKYIADLYGIEPDAVKSKLENIKTSFNINLNSTYVFSSYTKTSNDETIKFSISEELSDEPKELIAYTKSPEFIHVDLYNSEIKSIEINNSNKKISFTLEYDDYTYTFSIDNLSNSGNLKIIKNENQEETLTCTFNYSFDQNSQDKTTVSIKLNFKQAFNDEIANIEINSILNLNSGVEIEKISLENFEENTNIIKYSIKNIFRDFIENLKLYLD